jgi:hypothetical protein
MARSKILAHVAGKTLEGWDLDYFLSKALNRRRYDSLRGVLSDLEAWVDAQN